jgi:hypothetical protein
MNKEKNEGNTVAEQIPDSPPRVATSKDVSSSLSFSRKRRYWRFNMPFAVNSTEFSINALPSAGVTPFQYANIPSS